MEREPAQSRREARRTPAAEPMAGQAAALPDHRPAAIAQRHLAEAAQRQALTVQRESGMPQGLRSGVESLSGASLDGVKVHYNSSKPADLRALAYAQGKDIHLAPGQEKHLPHEAWHIAQQAQGRVRPTLQHGGAPINDDPLLEHEADVMGERALKEGAATTPQSGG